MKMKQTLNLSNYLGKNVKQLDDMTLRNVIYQVYGEWNSNYNRQNLEQISKAALDDCDITFTDNVKK